MAREFPSMTALLGLLAIAGYQNRDRIADLLRGGGAADPASVPASGTQNPGQRPQEAGGLGGLISDIFGTGGGGGSSLGGAGSAAPGGLLGNGLRELVERFQHNGMGDAASSWVSAGPNREVTPDELERTIGPDVLETLIQKTGLSREDLLARLSRDLPRTVDSLTPGGQLPGPA